MRKLLLASIVCVGVGLGILVYANPLLRGGLGVTHPAANFNFSRFTGSFSFPASGFPASGFAVRRHGFGGLLIPTLVGFGLVTAGLVLSIAELGLRAK